ncbi:MAG: hypothetical protein WED83_07695, partial [Acidimicrobiia bacterium]
MSGRSSAEATVPGLSVWLAGLIVEGAEERGLAGSASAGTWGGLGPPVGPVGDGGDAVGAEGVA